MRRTFVFYLGLTLLLALFGGGAWLTRNPDAEILRRAEGWPWIGPAASRFRAAYRSDGRAGAAGVETEEAGTHEGAEGEGSDRPEPVAPRVYRQQVWALGGMELKAEPAVDAATIYTFETHARAGKIEHRGDWYQVDYRGRTGWVLLEGYDENAEIPYGEVAEPPRPVPARAPDDQRLAAARRYLKGKERAVSAGPYALYTDCRDDQLIAYLDAVAGRLEAFYAERYGVRPVGDAAEAVVLFQSDIAYRLVQQQTERLIGLNAAGHNSEGVAVLYSGGRSRLEVAGTVVHELTHFLNRRAIGPQLPPWLDEGIADDLGLSRLGPDGRIQGAELSGGKHRQGDQWRIEGGLASLLRLRDAVHAGEMPAVPDLMSADWESFVRTPKIQLHYAAAAFWIRFLIEGDGGRHAPRFRAFLAAVAAGEPPTVATLRAKLTAEWSVLNAGFRAWIEERAESVEPGRGSP